MKLHMWGEAIIYASEQTVKREVTEEEKEQWSEVTRLINESDENIQC